MCFENMSFNFYFYSDSVETWFRPTMHFHQTVIQKENIYTLIVQHKSGHATVLRNFFLNEIYETA